ncbi:FAD dependent oxidoreductase-domain-containing protein [Lasiosphaeria miniovina]|uniref:FAD dependent oxidoreductase-domain-containing protein n=1 Tax=Lasiosphaeria miniovina TaxID=1954250 RepID=A0AA40DZF0_9PEZI|nr:FAD dependent oxidoreductase-domain-containing protein [Lasiosphaeria miniovina]KAK0718581.1 FAD dependent oxidoreductase-domain-containing protein [Lasiosphaeria miniovina]
MGRALGEFGFDPQVQPLGSFHTSCIPELAARAAVSGHALRSIGYSPLVVHAVFFHEYDPSNPRLPFPVTRAEELSKLPSWLRVRDTWKAGLINDGSTAARADPPAFCSFLQSDCEHLGVEFPTRAEAVRIGQHAGEEDSTVEFQVAGGELRQIACRNLIISAGSWSPALFSRLLPSAGIRLRLAPEQHVQAWLRFSAEDATDSEQRRMDTGACHQVWSSPLDEGDDVHVSWFTNGELHAAGALEWVVGETPPLPKDVQPSPEDVAQLKECVSRHLHIDKRRILSSGRAFMPAVPQGRPIMDRVPRDALAKGGYSVGVFWALVTTLTGSPWG